jgi:hypothetical protein
METQFSTGTLDLYAKLRTCANGSRILDLNLDVLRKTNLRLSGILVSQLIELKEAGLIRYHVNDIPSIEFLS